MRSTRIPSSTHTLWVASISEPDIDMPSWVKISWSATEIPAKHIWSMNISNEYSTDIASHLPMMSSWPCICWGTLNALCCRTCIRHRRPWGMDARHSPNMVSHYIYHEVTSLSSRQNQYLYHIVKKLSKRQSFESQLKYWCMLKWVH